MPDSQAGHFHDLKLGILFRSHNHQSNSANQHQATDQWRNRNPIMFVGCCVNRADVKNFFLMGVVESLISQSQATEYDEQNSEPCDWFHVICLFVALSRLQLSKLPLTHRSGAARLCLVSCAGTIRRAILKSSAKILLVRHHTSLVPTTNLYTSEHTYIQGSRSL